MIKELVLVSFIGHLLYLLREKQPYLIPIGFIIFGFYSGFIQIPSYSFQSDAVESEIKQDLTPYQEMAVDAARKEGIDPKLFLALIEQESAWKVDAVSPKGAVGLGQIMPSNAKSCGLTVDELKVPEENLRCSAFFLGSALRYWEGIYPNNSTMVVKKSLGEYNSGRDAVINNNSIDRYPETKNYVNRILTNYKKGD